MLMCKEPKYHVLFVLTIALVAASPFMLDRLDLHNESIYPGLVRVIAQPYSAAPFAMGLAGHTGLAYACVDRVLLMRAEVSPLLWVDVFYVALALVAMLFGINPNGFDSWQKLHGILAYAWFATRIIADVVLALVVLRRLRGTPMTRTFYVVVWMMFVRGLLATMIVYAMCVTGGPTWPGVLYVEYVSLLSYMIVAHVQYVLLRFADVPHE